ncbi:hypothetical protein EVAR_52307_1 [Eumeta japonica]|uniref:Uncharacterized protein n=1 Tax=Eumeta variegata TaxID=151549 RepID=A0A4C1Y318_EUMVA|nr:hypothetical protein EVAR_52307_1 [Eumeta japonica]
MKRSVQACACKDQISRRTHTGGGRRSVTEAREPENQIRHCPSPRGSLLLSAQWRTAGKPLTYPKNRNRPKSDHTGARADCGSRRSHATDMLLETRESIGEEDRYVILGTMSESCTRSSPVQARFLVFWGPQKKRISSGHRFSRNRSPAQSGSVSIKCFCAPTAMRAVKTAD